MYVGSRFSWLVSVAIAIATTSHHQKKGEAKERDCHPALARIVGADTVRYLKYARLVTVPVQAV